MTSDWSIQIPLSSLVALQGLPMRMEELEKANVQLRRELEALRTINSQLMEVVANLRQELHKR